MPATTMKLSRSLLSAGLLVAALGTVGRAQIERLDLEQIVTRSDNAVFATIVDKTVFRVDHPVDGPELYYTRLTLKGSSLMDGRDATTDVIFAGGFIDKERGIGSFNSEAPSEDDVRIGNRVVVFYKWTDNIGGDVSGNAIYAAHGGVYRTAKGPQGVVVLGRGEGFALEGNRKLAELDTAVTAIRTAWELEQAKLKQQQPTTSGATTSGQKPSGQE